MEQNKPQTEQELTQQAAVRRQHTADGALIAGGRQQRVVGAFQPGDAAPFQNAPFPSFQ